MCTNTNMETISWANFHSMFMFVLTKRIGLRRTTSQGLRDHNWIFPFKYDYLHKYIPMLVVPMEINSSVCDYVLLLPTYPLSLLKTWIFCTSKALTKYQTPRLRFQPRTCRNLILDQSLLFYHYARSTREILSFPKHYQL